MDALQQFGGYTMTVSALVVSKAKRFWSALEVRPRLLQFRQPPRHKRNDVASCQRWGLNKIAVVPQASPGVDWSSPVPGHEVSSTVSISVQALDSTFHPLLFPFPLHGEAPTLSDPRGEICLKLFKAVSVQRDNDNRAGQSEVSMLCNPRFAGHNNTSAQ